MTVRFRLMDQLRAAILLFALSFGLAAAFPGSVPSASAQGVSVEFRTALDPYGSWRNHSRWGDVWIPSDRGRDWRPYTVGRWSYTDDYGWYWRAADREAAWGSIVYHYGRWVLDEELGWVWIPGNVWAPAWVSWRRGEPPRGDHRHVVGWAPLPPDEIIVTIRDEPRYWAFVPARQLVAAELIASVVLPPQPVFIQETVIVHRTVVVRKGGATFAVSAGISPDYVALAYGRPIPSYSVRPVALAGTMAPPNAVTIRAEQYRDFRDKGRRGDQLRVEMREARQIQPARSVEPAQALAERDRVNPDTLPNAAKGAEIVSAPAAREQREGATTGAAKDAKGQPAQETGRQTDQQQTKDAAKDASKDATRDAKDAKDAARDDRPAQKGAARDAKDAADPSQKDAADRGKQGKDASKDAKRQKDAADQKDAKDRGKEAKDAAKDAKQDAADKARSKDSRAGKDAAREGRRDARQDRGRDQREGAAKEDGDARQKKDASEARERQKGQRESRSEREPKALRDDAARGQGRDAADRGRGGDQKRATGRDAAPDRPTVGTSGGREPAAPRQAIERGRDQGARGGGSRSEAPAAATTGRAPAAAAPRGGGGPAGGPGGGRGGPKGGDARD